MDLNKCSIRTKLYIVFEIYKFQFATENEMHFINDVDFDNLLELTFDLFSALEARRI